MKITRTVRWTRNLLPIAAVLALAVLPAAAAVQAQDGTPAEAAGSVVAGGTVTVAPAPAGIASPAGLDTAATPQAAATGLDGADTSPETSTAAQSAVGSVPSDESGSTEARTVQRSCGAGADSHYVPSSGRDANQCYDSKGIFQPSRTYTATHFTNDVTCGSENRITGSGATDTWLAGTAGADGGYVQVCSDDFTPAHGRVTVRGDADGSVQVVADGDKDNPEETSQGWASGTVSADGPSYRCGKSYAEGGRGSSDAPTSQDTDEQCAP